MKSFMKFHLLSLQLLVTCIAVMVLPQRGAAALGSRQWQITLSPTTTIVTPGVAATASTTVTIKEGSQLGASANGVTLTVAVSPPGAGVTAGLDSTGPFIGVLNTTTLNITNTAGAAAQAYTVTVTGASTFSGSSDFTAGDIN